MCRKKINLDVLWKMYLKYKALCVGKEYFKVATLKDKDRATVRTQTWIAAVGGEVGLLLK